MAGTITYGTQVIPETTRPASPPLNLSDTRNVVGTLNLGRGVLRPFVRNGQGDFANSNDLDLIRAEVGQTLGTIAASPVSRGEIPWRPEFGALLYRLRFSNLDESTIELARVYVIQAIENWNTRVKIRASEITVNTQERKLNIVISYDILSSKSRTAIATNQQTETELQLG
jgi:phage baseplate assembly protein W